MYRHILGGSGGAVKRSFIESPNADLLLIINLIIVMLCLTWPLGEHLTHFSRGSEACSIVGTDLDEVV